VTCVAYDSQLNLGVGQFSVTVSNAPVLTLPSNITVEATSAAGAVVSFTVTATDIATIDCTPASSGSTFPLGTTTVICTAYAETGDTSGSFTVTVVDTTPPTITSVTASPSNLWPPNHKMVDVTVTVIATDLVDPAPVSRIVSVSSNQPTEGTGDGDTPIDWIITGPLTVQLRAERSGNNDRVYTITIESTDFKGNAARRTVTVTVSQPK
jgi:hypothetical protein